MKRDRKFRVMIARNPFDRNKFVAAEFDTYEKATEYAKGLSDAGAPAVCVEGPISLFDVSR